MKGCLTCFVFLLFRLTVYGQQEIPLYEVVPNSKPTETKENIIYDKDGNSIIFYEALIKAGIGVEMHLYEKGGHGFGIAPDVENSWMELLFRWIQNQIK